MTKPIPAISEQDAMDLLLAATREGRLEGSALPEVPWPAATGITGHRPGDSYDVVLCMLYGEDRGLLLADNRLADCRDCGRRVQYRPGSPPGPRLCLPCAAAALLGEPMTEIEGDDAGLGPCCICEVPGAGNIVMLSQRAMVPGHGWGCITCGLPPDGAVAVLCDRCTAMWSEGHAELRFACRGWPGRDGRVPIGELPAGRFDHDEAKHAGECGK